ncbi:MAG: hypothetical protein ABI551_09370 [Polyangiaceae bacterium]
MSHRHFASAFLALGLLSFAAPSFADAIPPEVEDCTGHDVGEVCTLTAASANGSTSGTCQKSTCTSLSYSCDAGADAEADAATHGGPCGSTTYDCNKCVADAPSANDGGTNTGDGGTTTTPSADSGGCSASPADPVTGFGSLLLAASIFAGLFFRKGKSRV